MIVPVTRKEKLLNAIATSGNVDFSPKTREELFLFKILGADVNTPTPITRKELLYQHIIDGTIPTFEPRTRLEKFIMAAAGVELELPVVLTREEYWWAEISDSAYETITGAVVHFISKRARAIKSLIANISYTQDLHGYDSPWPAGGGKNLLDASAITENYIINNEGTLIRNVTGEITDYIPVTPSTQYVLSGTNLCATAQNFDVRVNYFTSGKTWTYRSGDNKTNVLTFTTDADTYYVRLSFSKTSTNQMLEKGSTATTYAPYSNICPISGWTGANVTRCGKNFAEIDSAWIGSSGTHNGITWRFNEDGSMTLDGTKTTSTASVLIWNLANAARISGTQSDNKKHIPNGDYFIYSGHNKVVIQVYGSNDENAGASNSYPIASGNLNPFRFTINDTYKYNWIRLNIGGNAVFDNYTFYPMVRLASDTGTEQAPYTGDTYSITFPSEAGTVYSGTLDVVTGELTVTHAEKIFVGADSESWARDPGNSNLNRYRIGVNGKQQTQRWPVACNEGVYPDSFSVNDVGTVFVSAGRLFFYPLPSINTVSLFKAWLADNPLQVVYELAEPITYQLTPTEVTTLLGENTIWADTGDVTVTY